MLQIPVDGRSGEQRLIHDTKSGDGRGCSGPLEECPARTVLKGRSLTHVNLLGSGEIAFGAHHYSTEKGGGARSRDRKSTRLNSSHGYISYAVFCLKKKTNKEHINTEHI